LPIIVRSRYNYADTVASLQRIITDGGNRIFCAIDQAAAAADVGMALRPTTLILFGNPQGGTLLMDAFPEVALALPLKILVWEDAGDVNVAYTSAADIAARYHITGMDERINAMDKSLAAITASVR
jgi:uncharacterized protein (DUF302 family)